MIHRSIGSAKIGIWYFTGPFAMLSAYESRLTLRVLCCKYEFLKEEILGVKKVGSIPIFRSGIQFLHESTAYPKTIIYWTVNRNSVWNILRSYGYPVAE